MPGHLRNKGTKKQTKKGKKKGKKEGKKERRDEKKRKSARDVFLVFVNTLSFLRGLSAKSV
jgi:hypothetical protein